MREDNVFTGVCPSVILSTGGSGWVPSNASIGRSHGRIPSSPSAPLIVHHPPPFHLLLKLYTHRAAAAVADARSIEKHGDASHDAWNGSGTDFGASPLTCISHCRCHSCYRCRSRSVWVYPYSDIRPGYLSHSPANHIW